MHICRGNFTTQNKDLYLRCSAKINWKIFWHVDYIVCFCPSNTLEVSWNCNYLTKICPSCQYLFSPTKATNILGKKRILRFIQLKKTFILSNTVCPRIPLITSRNLHEMIIIAQKYCVTN